MKKRIDITIINRLGLHLRAAAQLVQTVNQFKSEVWISKNEHRVNGKSIMGVMTLVATKDSVIVAEAQGEDAEQCLEAIRRLAAGRFGEKE